MHRPWGLPFCWYLLRHTRHRGLEEPAPSEEGSADVLWTNKRCLVIKACPYIYTGELNPMSMSAKPKGTTLISRLLIPRMDSTLIPKCPNAPLESAIMIIFSLAIIYCSLGYENSSIFHWLMQSVPLTQTKNPFDWFQLIWSVSFSGSGIRRMGIPALPLVDNVVSGKYLFLWVSASWSI